MLLEGFVALFQDTVGLLRLFEGVEPLLGPCLACAMLAEQQVVVDEQLLVGRVDGLQPVVGGMMLHGTLDWQSRLIKMPPTCDK